MKRVIFIIDGFNLYHSILSIISDTGRNYKWLDISSLCKSYLDRYGKRSEVQLIDVYYFTALREHLRLTNPATLRRHENYIKCLKNSGIKVLISNFKEKEIKCGATCKQLFKTHQEKETDVAIASKLLEVLVKNLCDIVVIITGDTDLRPAYNTAVNLFPSKLIEFAFPYNRKNKSLIGFKIKITRYAQSLLPNPYILNDGSSITKPSTW